MKMNHRFSGWIAAALLLAAGGALASDAPNQCTTSGGGWIVQASEPFDATPCPVANCTGMTYNLTPLRGETPDHVVVLVEHDTPIVIPPSTFDTAPCAGDNVTGLGTRDCSKQTARINQSQQKNGPFDLVVQGVVQPMGASIVVKKGTKITEQCRIESLGVPYDIDPHQQVASEQTFTFKSCKLKIPVDPRTGIPGTATLEGSTCKFLANDEPVDALSVSVNGAPIGNGTWASDGGFSTGQNSCTNRIISGRLYSICDCKTIPPDPRPPC
jgi:hypothetical protein